MENKKSLQEKRPWRHTLRLTFEYTGDKISLVDRRNVDMIIPPTALGSPTEKQSGFWFEIRDGNGKLLYSRVEHNPIRYDVEVFSNEPQESIVRRPVKDPKGTFVLLVPEIPEANHIDLYSSPLNEKRASEPAKKIASFLLKENKPKEEGKA